MYDRRINLAELLHKKSHFLLGPRQTGKSTLLRRTLPEASVIDLLDARVFRLLSGHPERLSEWIASAPRGAPIVIAEIQKLPELLDEVQRQVDRNQSLRFLLTGSSARKLKRQGVNLLGGRAWTQRLHALTYAECPEVPLARRLRFGSLPGVLTSDFPEEELTAYVGTYLREEIRAEGLARSLPAFSRFLEVAGACSGEQIRFSAIASDAQIPPRTATDYFTLLEDTLVASLLPPFDSAKKRKSVSTAKFYFFDVGVANAVAGTVGAATDSSNIGRRFEHLLHDELAAYRDYRCPTRSLTYWRTRTGLEVDFILGKELAVEVKSKENVRAQDLNGLLALGEEFPAMTLVVVCQAPFPRTVGRVEILPVEVFLQRLWAGEFAK